MVAGTFHMPSAVQKPLVFEATAHGVCLLLSRIQKNHSLFGMLADELLEVYVPTVGALMQIAPHLPAP